MSQLVTRSLRAQKRFLSLNRTVKRPVEVEAAAVGGVVSVSCVKRNTPGLPAHARPAVSSLTLQLTLFWQEMRRGASL